METNIFDPNYVQKQQVASLQRMAAEQNALRVQTFRQASADWITTAMRNRDLGLLVPAPPAIPKKIVVGDDGDWKEIDFDDLQVPVLPAPVVTPPPSGLRPATGIVPPDRLDQVLAALQYLNQKLDAVLKLVSVAMLCVALAASLSAEPLRPPVPVPVQLAAAAVQAPMVKVAEPALPACSPAVHGPYEDLAIEVVKLVGKVVDGQSPEVREALWRGYIADMEAWRKFWATFRLELGPGK